jgi:hypothetical protein
MGVHDPILDASMDSLYGDSTSLSNGCRLYESTDMHNGPTDTSNGSAAATAALMYGDARRLPTALGRIVYETKRRFEGLYSQLVSTPSRLSHATDSHTHC